MTEVFAEIERIHEPGSDWKPDVYTTYRDEIPINGPKDVEKLKAECSQLEKESAKEGYFDKFRVKFYKKIEPYETSYGHHDDYKMRKVVGTYISEEDAMAEILGSENK